MKKLKPRLPTPHPELVSLRGNEERLTRQLDTILTKANLTRESLRERVRQALTKQ